MYKQEPQDTWESVHVCPQCGYTMNLAVLDLKAITTGLVDCPQCDWSGRIVIEIIEANTLDT